MIPVILVKLKAFSSTKHNQKDLLKKERKKERKIHLEQKHLGDDIFARHCNFAKQTSPKKNNTNWAQNFPFLLVLCFRCPVMIFIHSTSP